MMEISTMVRQLCFSRNSLLGVLVSVAVHDPVVFHCLALHVLSWTCVKNFYPRDTDLSPLKVSSNNSSCTVCYKEDAQTRLHICLRAVMEWRLPFPALAWPLQTTLLSPLIDLEKLPRHASENGTFRLRGPACPPWPILLLCVYLLASEHVWSFLHYCCHIFMLVSILSVRSNHLIRIRAAHGWDGGYCMPSIKPCTDLSTAR